jgi:hypothetical protein
MNTRLTRRQTSLSDRATLVLPRYPEVNALMRTDAKAQKTFVNVIYGKQSLIDAGAGSAAATMPIAEGCERRIDPSNNRSPAAADYPRAASSTGRRR